MWLTVCVGPSGVRQRNFEEIVKSAISLGNDTDTTACIAGGIAGLKFGLKAIPDALARKSARQRKSMSLYWKNYLNRFNSLF